MGSALYSPCAWPPGEQSASPSRGHLREKYEILHEVGSGSSGVIYLARSREGSPSSSPRAQGATQIACKGPAGRGGSARGSAAASWPRAFGTAPCCPRGSRALLQARVVVAAIFAVHWFWRLVLDWGQGLWWLCASNWAMTEETLYFCLLVYTTRAAQPEMPRNAAQIQTPRGISALIQRDECSRPFLVEVTLVLHIVQLPLSFAVAALYWTQPRPVWSIQACAAPDWLTCFEHGGNFLLCLLSFLFSRIPFDLRSSGWFIASVAAYLLWMLLHHWLRGGRAWHGLPAAQLRHACPSHGALDGRHLAEVLRLALVACLGLGPLVACGCWLLGLARDGLDRGLHGPREAERGREEGA